MQDLKKFTCLLSLL